MKTRGLKKFGVILLVLFLIIPLICALTATISNPRMVLYGNITKGEVLTIENSVIVVNDNEHETIINVAPTGIWEDKVEIYESNFTLDAWERKEVFYLITIDEAGNYQGDILITFEEEDSKNKLSLAQELEVYVKDINQNSKITGGVTGISNSKFFIILGIGFILILVMTLLIIIKTRGKKK